MTRARDTVGRYALVWGMARWSDPDVVSSTEDGTSLGKPSTRRPQIYYLEVKLQQTVHQ